MAAAVARLGYSHWQWRPVAAGASDDGSLGWTVGEGEIVLPGVGGEPDRVRDLTYLTLWQRQGDGSIRFIADGTSPMP